MSEVPFSAVPLLGLLTALFLVLVIAQEFTGVMEALEPVARVGLVAAGAPWLALSLAQVSGSREPLWLIPAIYLGAALIGSRPLVRRFREGARGRRTGEWRCLKCEAMNPQAELICGRCGAWNPDRDRRR